MTQYLNSSEFQSFLRQGALLSLDPGFVLLGWGEESWNDQPSPSAFYFPDFFLREKPWLIFSNYKVVEVKALKEMLQREKANPPPLAWNNPHPEIFYKSFDELQGLFAQNSLTKAVPYTIQKCPLPLNKDQKISSIISALHYIQKAPSYIYGFWDEKQGLLGATPEILFTSEKKEKHTHLKSAAVAGTAKNLEDLHTPKNLREHAIVVEGIQQSLSAFGKVHLGELKTIVLPHLSHLYTPLELLLDKDPSLEDLVDALHPTPALGAFPKKEGLNWLKEFERLVPRKRYGAPAGAVFQNKTRCYVAIRNVQWDESGSQMGAGCGVVAESNKEDEWNEILLKLKAIKGILSL